MKNPSLKNPKRILVRAPNWIGDQILAYPFFYALRKAYPDAHIASACVPWVQDLQFSKQVDEVLVLEQPERRESRLDRLQAVERSAAKIRALGPWDWGISLPNSFSAAWFLKRSGAKRRRGYLGDARGWLLTEKLDWDPSPGRHRAQAYLELLPKELQLKTSALEFWGTPPPDEDPLSEPIPGVMEKFPTLQEWGTQDRMVTRPSGPYWVLAPGATAESRRWPLDRFASLAEKIIQETGWKGVVVGGTQEVSQAMDLCEKVGPQLIDMTAQGPIPVLSQLLEGARFTVCNESGFAHVAALHGCFTQIICGAANPIRTRPLGPGRVQVMVNPVDCWPCERNTCSQPMGNQFICLRGIEVEQVWQEIRRGLKLG